VGRNYRKLFARAMYSKNHFVAEAAVVDGPVSRSEDCESES
jgi:hypothetical protein